MNIKKGFTLIELLVVITIIGILSVLILSFFTKKADACGWIVDCGKSPSANEQQQKSLESNQEKIISAVPIPQLSDSLERKNISDRAQLFNKPDKVSYIYLVNFGKVMAFYTVKGKVSSLNSFMSPQEQLVDGDGNKCTRNYTSNGSYEPCYSIQAPDIDGSYGDNANGIFFFTTEGAYVEWKGDYMMSDQPLKLSTQPELVREVK